MSDIQLLKNKARVLGTFLRENGADLSHGVCLNAIARLEQHKCWATLLAAEEKAQAKKSLNEAGSNKKEKFEYPSGILPLGVSSTVSSDTLEFYRRVLNPLVADFAETTTVLSVMEALESLCRTGPTANTGSVETRLREVLKDEYFTLNAPYDNFSAKSLMSYLRRQAKDLYELG